MKDTEVTVAELRKVVDQFVEERNWKAFHTPKNLAMSMSIEVAELMEHFQWKTPEESLAVAGDPEQLIEISHELADVACYLLAMSSALGIDVAAAVEQKMVLNRQKYPVG